MPTIGSRTSARTSCCRAESARCCSDWFGAWRRDRARFGKAVRLDMATGPPRPAGLEARSLSGGGGRTCAEVSRRRPRSRPRTLWNQLGHSRPAVERAVRYPLQLYRAWSRGVRPSREPGPRSQNRPGAIRRRREPLRRQPIDALVPERPVDQTARRSLRRRRPFSRSEGLVTRARRPAARLRRPLVRAKRARPLGRGCRATGGRGRVVRSGPRRRRSVAPANRAARGRARHSIAAADHRLEERSGGHAGDCRSAGSRAAELRRGAAGGVDGSARAEAARDFDVYRRNSRTRYSGSLRLVGAGRFRRRSLRSDPRRAAHPDGET